MVEKWSYNYIRPGNILGLSEPEFSFLARPSHEYCFFFTSRRRVKKRVRVTWECQGRRTRVWKGWRFPGRLWFNFIFPPLVVSFSIGSSHSFIRSITTFNNHKSLEMHMFWHQTKILLVTMCLPQATSSPSILKPMLLLSPTCSMVPSFQLLQSAMNLIQRIFRTPSFVESWNTNEINLNKITKSY